MGLNTTAATWVAAATLTAAQLNTEVRDAVNGIQAAWTSWTPTPNSGLTVGNGVWAGAYLQVGKDIKARFSFTLGTTSSVTGVIVIQFPILVSSTYAVTSCVGSAAITDASAGSAGRFSGTCHLTSTVAGGVGAFAFGGSTTGQQANATNPMTWASTDILTAVLTYEAA